MRSPPVIIERVALFDDGVGIIGFVGAVSAGETMGGEKKFVGTLAGEVVVIRKHSHEKSGVFGEDVGVLKADVFAVKRGGEREGLHGNDRA
jgi:hypothetical protein